MEENKANILIRSLAVVLWALSFLLVFLACKSDPSKETLRDFKQVLKTVDQYEYGESRAWLQDYYDLLASIHNDISIQAEAERLMIEVLESKSSAAGKLVICKTLGALATEASIPVLQQMLEREETAHLAVMALIPIRSPLADQALMETMPQKKGNHVIELINALALRKSTAAIDVLEPYLLHENTKVSEAVMHALGEIGGTKSIQILDKTFEENKSPACAEALMTALNTTSYPDAERIHQSIFESELPLSLRTASFIGVLELQPEENKVGFAQKMFLASPMDLQESMLHAIRQLPKGLDVGPFIDELPSLKPPIQQQLMLVLAERGETDVRPFVLSQLRSTDSQVRISALKAMKSIANPEDLDLLASIASNTSGLEQELARQGIYWMKDEDANQRIFQLARSSNILVKPELIKAIGYRKVLEGQRFVLDQISSTNLAVRLSAIEASGSIGKKEHLAELLRNVNNAKDIDANESEVFIESITRIAQNSNELEFCVNQIRQALSDTENDRSVSVMVRALGNIHTDGSLDILLTFLQSEHMDIQFSCLKAFAEWPDDAPLEELERTIPDLETPKNRQQALVSMVTLVQNSSQIENEEKASKLINAYSELRSRQEKIIVLNGLSRLWSLDAMDFILEQLNDQEIAANARECFIRIAGELRYSYGELIVGKLDSLLQVSDSEEFKSTMSILKRSIEL